MGIKALIFDFGGVCTVGHLLKDFSLRLSAQCSYSKDDIERVFREFDRPYETGEISPEEFWGKFKHKLNLELSMNELQKLFFGSYRINQDVLDLIKQSRNKYKTVLFTNNYQDLFEYIKQQYDLSDYFDILISSSSMHLRKPEEVAYWYLLKRLGLIAEECVFIDDKQKNIDSAKSLGINGVVYGDFQQLKQELSLLGVDVGSGI